MTRSGLWKAVRLFCACAGMPGCALIEGLGDVTLGSPDAGSAGVSIDVPGGTSYGIDPTEVTNAAYLAWLATKPDPTDQPTECGWNKTFALATSGNGCDSIDPHAWPNRPVGCVNWCQARAYCSGTGGHLCGRIGGGSVRQGEENDPDHSEWYRACSLAGMYVYPYGDNYEPSRCNTSGNKGVTVDVKEFSSCVGGYDGIYDMSGNTEEWEDSRPGIGSLPNDYSDDDCTTRGGAYWSGDVDATCSSNRPPPRNYQTPDVGFRCCH